MGCSSEDNKTRKGKFSGFVVSDSMKNVIKLMSINDSAQVLDIKSAQKNISFNIIDSMDYVSLETTTDSRIGQICKIKIHNDRIYILDNVTSKNLYIFRIDGKFINKIRGFGEGPLEILDPYDFDIDVTSNQLAILDGKLSKIVYYDLDGSPIKQRKIFYRIQNFRFFDESTIICFVGLNDNSHLGELGNYNLLVVDSAFNIKYKAFERFFAEEKNRYTLLDHLHNSSRRGIVFSPRFTNEIFKIDSADVSKMYRIIFPDETPMKYYKEDSEILFKYAKDYKKYFFDGTYEENNSIIYTKIFTPLIRDQIHIFYEKKSKKYIYGKVPLDLGSKKILLWSLPLSSYRNKFISPISSEILSQFKSIKDAHITFDPKFHEIVKKSHEYDNPVLQFYSINIDRVDN